MVAALFGLITYDLVALLHITNLITYMRPICLSIVMCITYPINIIIYPLDYLLNNVTMYYLECKTYQLTSLFHYYKTIYNIHFMLMDIIFSHT